MKRRSRVLLAMLLAGLLGGCVSVEHLADTMNNRNISSCITFSGAYGVFVGIHGVTATGGATIAECLALR